MTEPEVTPLTQPFDLIAVLTARSTYCVPVGSDEPCPDCDAPGKELCHWYCPRYEDGPDE
jgi:hypothetical protein